MKNKSQSVEINETKHFDEYAKKYDSNYNYHQPFTKYKINKKTNDFVDFVTSRLGKKRLKILEVGCGTGEYTKIIAQKFPESKITGIDISPGILKVAKKKCKNCKNTNFVVLNAYDTRLPKGSYDVIVGFYVLHHIDVSKFAKEAFKILKSGGLLFFYEPNILNPFVYLVKSNKYIKKMVGDSPDEWGINPLTIKNVFKGFKVAKIVTTEYVLPLSKVPLKLMIVLDSILSYFSQVPLLKYLGGSVQILMVKKQSK